MYGKELGYPKTCGKYDNRYSPTVSFMFSKLLKNKIHPSLKK